jgi:prepilin-type processing-associated H-X9-DG protein
MARENWKPRLLPVLALGLIVLVVGAFYAAVRAARRATIRQQRTNHLKQVGLALYNFDTAYGRLPPAVRVDAAGHPLCSWRFQVVPYVEAFMRGIDFDARWDDPANEWFASLPLIIYCWLPNEELPRCLHTNVGAITGPGTAFDANRPRRLSEMDSDTVLAIEMADFDKHWMEPGDLRVDEVPESIVKGVDGEGVHVLFADGSVWFLGADVPLEDLKKFFTIDGAKQYDRQEVLGPYRWER